MDILEIMKKHNRELRESFNLKSISIVGWTHKGGVPRKLYWKRICEITGIPYGLFSEFMEARLEIHNKKLQKQKVKSRTYSSKIPDKPTRQEIMDAVKAFQKKGGKITRISPQPSSKHLLTEDTFYYIDDSQL